MNQSRTRNFPTIKECPASFFPIDPHAPRLTFRQVRLKETSGRANARVPLDAALFELRMISAAFRLELS